MMKWTVAACVAFLLSGTAFAEPVDLELALVVDVSGSVDSYEHDLQRRGYADAFRDPRVLDAIRANPLGRIAVTMVEYAGADQQAQITPWILIRDSGSAGEFAAAIIAAPRTPGRWTSISGGIDFAMPLFENNGYEGQRLVMDVSGDGPNNSGRSAESARDDAVAKGVVINGLAILNDRPNPGGAFWQGRQPMVNLEEYYLNSVIGGLGAFLITTNNFEDFGRAVIQKLIREIAQQHSNPGTGLAGTAPQ